MNQEVDCTDGAMSDSNSSRLISVRRRREKYRIVVVVESAMRCRRISLSSSAVDSGSVVENCMKIRRSKHV